VRVNKTPESFHEIYRARTDEAIAKDIAVARDGTGRLWAAWHSYYDGADSILACSRDEDGRSTTHVVSSSPGAHFNPAMACHGRDVYVFWSCRGEESWSVLGKRYTGGNWEDVPSIEGAPASNLHTAACADVDGRLWLAWVRADAAGRCVLAKYFDGRWSEEARVSQSGAYYSRPTFGTGPGGEVWLAWDGYDESGLNVFAARRNGNKWSAPCRVSASSDWEFIPSIAVDGEGTPRIAWVRLRDVRNSAGVVDQKASIMCADFRQGTWRTHEDVALLYQGLLARTAAWGYLGRRRRPMMAGDADGGAWLFWEIKPEAEGRTTDTGGILLARHFDGASWNRPMEIHRGKLGYVICNDRIAADGRLDVVARSGEERADSALTAGRFDLARCKEADLADPAEWDIWVPHRLPESEPKPPTQTIEIAGETFKLFWGDLHCHGWFSFDAEGELDELLFYARDKAHLDFCAVADNDNYVNKPLTFSEWRLTQWESDRFTRPGEFVALCAYEWTFMPDRKTNHRIIVFRDSQQQILRHVDNGEMRSLADLVSFMKDRSAFVFAHHPYWELTDSPLERNVEVCSGWGIYIEDADTIRKNLDAGRKFGFIGASDSHRRGPGMGGALTGVFAKELTREAIFDALTARRTIATNGTRVLIDFRINGRPVGEEIESDEPPVIAARVAAPCPIMHATVIRNGEVLRKFAPGEDSLRFEFRDDSAPPGESYYYLKVVLEGESPRLPSNLAPARGNLAWSSPIWVERA